MPNRETIDPFLLREQSQRIGTSFSLPIGYLTVLRKHAVIEGITFSQWMVNAIRLYAEKTGLELPEVTGK